MPAPTRRTRSHELEDESRREFGRALPGRWVCRDQSHDYGIDAEVEVFTDDGRTTGYVFNVQLRGTDAELSRALLPRVKTLHLDYWRSLPAPTLVVRYHAPSGRLFGKWADTHDPYPRDVANATTQTMHLSEADELTAERVRGLAEDAELRRAVTSGQPRLPIHVCLRLHPQTYVGLNRLSVLRAFAAAAHPFRRFITVSYERRRDGIDLRIEPLLATASIGGFKSVTAHYPRGRDGTLQPAPEEMIFIAGLLLADTAAAHIGAQIALAVAPRVSTISDPRVSGRLLALCRSTGRYRELIHLVDELERRGHGDVTPMRIELMVASGSLSDDERAAYDQLAQWAIERAIDSAERAKAHYNYGSHLRAARRRAEAVHEYELAAELEPAYRDRTYWCEELAAMKFSLGDYAAAESLYSRAVDIDSSDLFTRARRGDARVALGDWRAALVDFDASCDEPTPLNAAFRIKRLALHMIANAEVDESRGLDAAYWRAVGDAEAEADPLRAGMSYAIAAAMSDSDFTLYAIAATLLIDVDPDGDLLADVLRRVSRSPDDFLESLGGVLAECDETVARSVEERISERVLAVQTNMTDELKVRFHYQDGGYGVLRLGLRRGF